MPSLAPRSPARSSRPRRWTGALAAVGLVALGACTPTITVEVAPDATDPLCASIVLALPENLGGAERLRTTSQATAAWGVQSSAITLRCGVEPPGPTTEACQAIEDASGTSVDWLVVEDEDEGSWTFTTYGRVPAVEVTVPDGVATAPVVDLNRSVSLAPQSRHCY